MIRPAHKGDKVRVVRLLKEAHANAGFPFEFSAPHAAALFDACLGDLDRLCLVTCDGEGQAQGVLMASAANHPFGAFRLASEIVWFITPAFRGRAGTRMLQAYEEWAAERGCSYVAMSALQAAPEAALLYRRRGYREAEIYYLRATA